ncbi:hypothetical protein NUW58_g2840 [Xylaria curta]|uniref:Uncharacterized protein n=1 Tax=Xylaria curta TaxID=42375 RepID=A0ACC1PDL9_9PEZI|nr:hypothetical protein NUW58_g2840 [Xylaria curta]
MDSFKACWDFLFQPALTFALLEAPAKATCVDDGGPRPGISQHLHELSFVEILDLSDREYTNTRRGVDEHVVEKLGGHGKPIQDKGVYMLQLSSIWDVAPYLAALVDAGDVELGSGDLCQIEISEHAGGGMKEMAEGTRRGGDVENSGDWEVGKSLVQNESVGKQVEEARCDFAGS